MREVVVNKTELLAKLKENLAKHLEDYKQTVEVYCKVARKELAKRAREIKAGKPVPLHFELQAPHNYEIDYEQAIAMLEMSVEDNIRLSQGEFRMYVLDQWGWKLDYENTKMSYNSSR